MEIKDKFLKWGNTDMADLDLTKLISHYAQSNKAEGKSPVTVSWYTEMLFQFVKFLRSTDRGAFLGEFHAGAVREYIIQEQGRGLSPFSVQSKVRALKAFSSWLFAEGYTQENLLARVKLPKVPKKIVEPLTAAEIDNLLAAQDPQKHGGSRNIAVLVTLLDSGVRLSELCGLRFEDAHVEEGYLKVFGKGSKERVVPIGGLAQKVLWRYVFHFRPEPINDGNDYLFLTLYGEKLQPNAVKLLLKRWGKRAGVPRLHAHLCRHSFATCFLTEKCGDVFRLKQILGHSTLEMVNRYVHYASAESMLRNRVSSPVDQMGIKRLKGNRVDRLIRAKNRVAAPRESDTRGR